MKKIKCKIDCFTPTFDLKWKAGEVVEVVDEIANKLLTNKNFVLAEEVSKQIDTTKAEIDEDGSIHRKKRIGRDRN